MVYLFLLLPGLLGLTTCLQVGLGQGLAEIPGVEISAAANLPVRNIKVEGRMFLPDRASSVRAVIVATNYTLLHEGIGIQLLYANQLRHQLNCVNVPFYTHGLALFAPPIQTLRRPSSFGEMQRWVATMHSFCYCSVSGTNLVTEN